MKYLIIDKTNISAKILIVNERQEIIKKIQKNNKGSFLTIIKNILENTKSVHPIKEKVGGIVVVAGPDTFSISRSSTTIANILSYVWNVPVVGVDRRGFKNDKELVKLGIDKLRKKHIKKFAMPVYNKEPNITLKV